MSNDSGPTKSEKRLVGRRLHSERREGEGKFGTEVHGEPSEKAPVMFRGAQVGDNPDHDVRKDR